MWLSWLSQVERKKSGCGINRSNREQPSGGQCGERFLDGLASTREGVLLCHWGGMVVGSFSSRFL